MIKKNFLIIFLILFSVKSVNAIDHFVWAYGINKYIHYKIDGTKIVESDPNKIFHFIYPRVKLVISGQISGIEGIPFEKVGIPYLSYASSGLVSSDTRIGGPWSLHCKNNAPDSYFLYDGVSRGRIYKANYGTFAYPLYIHDVTNVDLRNNYTDYLQTVTDQQPANCGLYMDDTFGFLTDYSWTKFVSELSEVKSINNSSIWQIQSSQPISPMPDKPCLVWDLFNNLEIPVYSIWIEPWNRKDVSFVYLKNTCALTEGMQLMLQYYAPLKGPGEYQIAHSDFSPIKNEDYKNGMVSFLQQLKEKVGNNKLIIYNGCNTNYDAYFLQYADGCHSENTFYTSDKIYWKPGVDEEIEIANLNKKFLSFNFKDADSDIDLIKEMFFSYASFLLGVGNGSLFSFSTSANRGKEFIWFDFYDCDVGDPLSGYTKAIDPNTARPFDENTYVFQRNFTNSLVLVNVENISLTVALPLGTYYYFEPNTNWALKDVSSVITIPPKSGIILFKSKPVQTSVNTTSTSTILKSTSTKPTSTTTISFSTTTSISTTSTIPPLTTTSLPNTSTIFPECTTDADCDDNIYCNGAEKCNDGVCIPGIEPCQAGQICNESKDQCKNVRTKPGKSFPETITRPVSNEVQTKLLVVKTTEDNSFNRVHSNIVFVNSEGDVQGVKLDTVKKAFKLKTWFGSLIFLPIQVSKNAMVGKWEVFINTELIGGEPTEEIIATNFTVK
jgi:hypothetical protein